MICNSNQKLRYDSGWQKYEKNCKIVVSSTAPMGPQLWKIHNFQENCLFSGIIHICATTSVSCTIVLDRTTNTEKNDALFIEICSYLIKILTFYALSHFATCRKTKIGQNFITILSFELFWYVIYHSIWFQITFPPMYYSTLLVAILYNFGINIGFIGTLSRNIRESTISKNENI